MSEALPPLGDIEEYTLDEIQGVLAYTETMLVREKYEAEARQNRYYTTVPQARGRFLLGEAVQPSSVTALIRDMDTWSQNHPGDDITLVINSPGGVVIDGFALYDFLRILSKRGHRIITEGLGMQASMGGIMLQAGDERYMAPRSWLLIHQVQGIAAGSFAEMEDDMKFNKRLQDQALDILAARSTLSRRQIDTRWQRKDWWLSAEDALKHGFIDGIIDL